MIIKCQTEEMNVGEWDVEINSAVELYKLWDFIDCAIKAFKEEQN